MLTLYFMYRQQAVAFPKPRRWLPTRGASRRLLRARVVYEAWDTHEEFEEQIVSQGFPDFDWRLGLRVLALQVSLTGGALAGRQVTLSEGTCWRLVLSRTA